MIPRIPTANGETSIARPLRLDYQRPRGAVGQSERPDLACWRSPHPSLPPPLDSVVVVIFCQRGFGRFHSRTVAGWLREKGLSELPSEAVASRETRRWPKSGKPKREMSFTDKASPRPPMILKPLLVVWSERSRILSKSTTLR